MKKWLPRCAVTAALILVALLVVKSQFPAPGIRAGKPLPPGQVQPQLANAWDIAILSARRIALGLGRDAV